MTEDWPFEEPRNAGVITIRQIMREGAPILNVSLSDEGDWQFLGGEMPEVQDAMVVALSSIVECDPSVAQLHDMPLGWRAWRESVHSPWMREPDPEYFGVRKRQVRKAVWRRER